MLMLHHISDKEGGSHAKAATWAASYLVTLLQLSKVGISFVTYHTKAVNLQKK